MSAPVQPTTTAAFFFQSIASFGVSVVAPRPALVPLAFPPDLLARYGDQTGPERRIPTISQETLAEMIGTTRSRVNFFMNKFRDLGYIEYNGDITMNTSLLSVVLHD